MKVDISPTVALKEAQAEIAWLRNRNLILAQAVDDLRAKLAVEAVPEPAADPDTPAKTADEKPV